ncbi:hypothetical protein Cadr_000026359 [Camelus dromedarius]|uniref:Uncharacterized protein n=1 Tax=Camelus dromedarius TaxID=9838 RepID=A0A5N4CDY2_CAMDR|nr:hypothetical protein Cadr_000026359 [Camelus dromedarius]
MHRWVRQLQSKWKTLHSRPPTLAPPSPPLEPEPLGAVRRDTVTQSQRLGLREAQECKDGNGGQRGEKTALLGSKVEAGTRATGGSASPQSLRGECGPTQPLSPPPPELRHQYGPCPPCAPREPSWEPPPEAKATAHLRLNRMSDWVEKGEKGAAAGTARGPAWVGTEPLGPRSAVPLRPLLRGQSHKKCDKPPDTGHQGPQIQTWLSCQPGASWAVGTDLYSGLPLPSHSTGKSGDLSGPLAQLSDAPGQDTAKPSSRLLLHLFLPACRGLRAASFNGTGIRASLRLEDPRHEATCLFPCWCGCPQPGISAKSQQVKEGGSSSHVCLLPDAHLNVAAGTDTLSVTARTPATWGGAETSTLCSRGPCRSNPESGDVKGLWESSALGATSHQKPLCSPCHGGQLSLDEEGVVGLGYQPCRAARVVGQRHVLFLGPSGSPRGSDSDVDPALGTVPDVEEGETGGHPGPRGTQREPGGRARKKGGFQRDVWGHEGEAGVQDAPVSSSVVAVGTQTGKQVGATAGLVTCGVWGPSRRTGTVAAGPRVSGHRRDIKTGISTNRKQGDVGERGAIPPEERLSLAWKAPAQTFVIVRGSLELLELEAYVTDSGTERDPVLDDTSRPCQPGPTACNGTTLDSPTQTRLARCGQAGALKCTPCLENASAAHGLLQGAAAPRHDAALTRRPRAPAPAPLVTTAQAWGALSGCTWLVSLNPHSSPLGSTLTPPALSPRLRHRGGDAGKADTGSGLRLSKEGQTERTSDARKGFEREVGGARVGSCISVDVGLLPPLAGVSGDLGSTPGQAGSSGLCPTPEATGNSCVLDPAVGPRGTAPPPTPAPSLGGRSAQFSTAAASLSPHRSTPCLRQCSMIFLKMCFHKTKARKGRGVFWVLGNSSLWLGFTQQRRGLQEQKSPALSSSPAGGSRMTTSTTTCLPDDGFTRLTRLRVHHSSLSCVKAGGWGEGSDVELEGGGGQCPRPHLYPLLTGLCAPHLQGGGGLPTLVSCPSGRAGVKSGLETLARLPGHTEERLQAPLTELLAESSPHLLLSGGDCGALNLLRARDLGIRKTESCPRSRLHPPRHSGPWFLLLINFRALAHECFRPLQSLLLPEPKSSRVLHLLSRGTTWKGPEERGRPSSSPGSVSLAVKLQISALGLALLTEALTHRACPALWSQQASHTGPAAWTHSRVFAVSPTHLSKILSLTHVVQSSCPLRLWSHLFQEALRHSTPFLGRVGPCPSEPLPSTLHLALYKPLSAAWKPSEMGRCPTDRCASMTGPGGSGWPSSSDEPGTVLCTTCLDLLSLSNPGRRGEEGGKEGQREGRGSSVPALGSRLPVSHPQRGLPKLWGPQPLPQAPSRTPSALVKSKPGRGGGAGEFTGLIPVFTSFLSSSVAPFEELPRGSCCSIKQGCKMQLALAVGACEQLRSLGAPGAQNSALSPEHDGGHAAHRLGHTDVHEPTPPLTRTVRTRPPVRTHGSLNRTCAQACVHVTSMETDTQLHSLQPPPGLPDSVSTPILTPPQCILCMRAWVSGKSDPISSSGKPFRGLPSLPGEIQIIWRPLQGRVQSGLGSWSGLSPGLGPQGPPGELSPPPCPSSPLLTYHPSILHGPVEPSPPRFALMSSCPVAFTVLSPALATAPTELPALNELIRSPQVTLPGRATQARAVAYQPARGERAHSPLLARLTVPASEKLGKDFAERPARGGCCCQLRVLFPLTSLRGCFLIPHPSLPAQLSAGLQHCFTAGLLLARSAARLLRASEDALPICQFPLSLEAEGFTGYIPPPISPSCTAALLVVLGQEQLGFSAPKGRVIAAGPAQRWAPPDTALGAGVPIATPVGPAVPASAQHLLDLSERVGRGREGEGKGLETEGGGPARHQATWGLGGQARRAADQSAGDVVVPAGAEDRWPRPEDRATLQVTSQLNQGLQSGWTAPQGTPSPQLAPSLWVLEGPTDDLIGLRAQVTGDGWCTLEPGGNFKKGVGELGNASPAAQSVESTVGSWGFKGPLNHSWQGQPRLPIDEAAKALGHPAPLLPLNSRGGPWAEVIRVDKIMMGKAVRSICSSVRPSLQWMDRL